MRIYQVNIEHVRYGRNYDNEKVAARSFSEAVRKAKKFLTSVTRIESVELLEATT